MAFRRLTLLSLLSVCALFTACKSTKTTPTPSGPSVSFELSRADGVFQPVAKEGEVPLSVRAYVTQADGTETPLLGTVTFTTDERGSVAPTTITLVQDGTRGTGSAKFKMCKDGPKCIAQARATVTASLQTTTGEVADPISIAFTIQADPPDTCNKANAAVCTDPACAGSECTSDVGPGRCNGTSLQCVVLPPNDGSVVLEVSFSYKSDSANAAKTPTIIALPKGSETVVVKAKLTKVSTTTTLDLTKLHVKYELSASAAGVVPGSLHAPESATLTGDVTIDPKDGVATAYLEPSVVPASGQLKITVLNEDNSERPNLADIRPINVVVPGTLVFSPKATDAYYRTLGLQGSGFQEQSVLRFALLDSAGNPWRPALGEVKVSFDLTNKTPGMSVSPLVASVDASGEVVTTVYSGTDVASAAVKATAMIGNTPLTTNSETFAVVGVKPSSNNFAVSCDKAAINALIGNDCATMRQDLTASCTAVVRDRFNNPVGQRVRVSFATEAGTVGQPSLTPLANPDNPNDSTAGKAVNFIRTMSGRMPRDVDPEPGEPNTLGDGSDPCARAGVTHVYNPRDGLVTYIAYTQGEEWFDDSNKNGKQDGNEAFDDLSEPFVDFNDNNEFDADIGEIFIDTNGNGQWDPANGKWDSDTVIWTTGHIVFADEPKDSVTVDPDPNLGAIDLKSLKNGQAATLRVRWTDLNGNEPAAATATYTSSLVTGTGTVGQTTVQKYPDRFGVMQVRTFRKTTKVGSVDTFSSETQVSYSSQPQQVLVYTAPPSTSSVTNDDGTVTTLPSEFTGTIGAKVDLADIQASVSMTRDVANEPLTCLNKALDAATPSQKDAVCTLKACNGQPCRLNNADGICAGLVCKVGSSGTTSYLVDVKYTTPTGEDAAQRVVAGGDPITVRVTVTNRATGAREGDFPLTIDASNGIGLVKDTSGGAAATSVSLKTAKTGADIGVAVGTFVPGTTPAKGNITVTIDGSTIRRQVDIVVPGLLQFSPGSADNFVRVMGITSSGWREQNVLRFKLLDSVGQPYLGEAEVQFTVTPLGGARVVPSSLKIDSNGEVVTQVYSGVQAGTLSVTATTTIGGKTLTIQSDTIAVVGAKANGRNLALRCDTLAMPALLNNDCSYTHSDFTASCTAVVGDRFNNTLGRDTRVTWLSEAGLFGPPSSTPLANPDAEPAGQPGLGRTVNTLRTLNTPLPLDVAADNTILPGESARSSAVGGACPRTGNPRDGLVTLIAATEGEEGFIDANNNGQWDSGEKFYDLGEPYVDANDDGTYNTGELYIDVDGNGAYTQANGRWDSNTTIWTTSYVAYTGQSTPTFNFPTNPTSPSTAPFADYDTSFNFTVDWRDENGNEPAPTFSTYDLELASNYSRVRVLNGGNRLDQVGSMLISRPTVCGYSATSPDACKLTTTMALTTRLLSARYSAPDSSSASSVPLGDTIIASLESPDGALGKVTMSGSVDIPAAALPSLTALSPAGGPTDTFFTISGSKLNGVGSATYFRDSSGTTYQLPVSAFSSSTQLSVKVPTTATAGDAMVYVTNTAGTSSSLKFVVGVAPTITSFTPTSGVPGQARVTMFGTGLDVSGLQIYIGTARIEPAVAPATTPVFYRSANQLRFLVPVGARTGKITIVTDAGTVISATDFTVPAPTITTDFSAMGSVNVGDTLTVTGTDFNAGGLLVDVGGILVPNTDVTNVTNTSFDFVVPAGAVTSKVSVTTNGGSAISSTSLSVN